MTKITASSETELSDITYALNDQLVDIASVELDPATRTLVAEVYVEDVGGQRTLKRIAFLTKRIVPHHMWTLQIHDVAAYRAEDTQRIRWYSVDELQYDATTKLLRLRTNEPCVLEAHVDGLHVSLESSDEIAGYREVWTLLGASLSGRFHRDRD